MRYNIFCHIRIIHLKIKWKVLILAYPVMQFFFLVVNLCDTRPLLELVCPGLTKNYLECRWFQRSLDREWLRNCFWGVPVDQRKIYKFLTSNRGKGTCSDGMCGTYWMLPKFKALSWGFCASFRKHLWVCIFRGFACFGRVRRTLHTVLKI